MVKKNKWVMFLLVFLAVAVIIVGGYLYISSVQQSFWMQAVTDVREVTFQGGHAFEVYVQKDTDSVHGLALNLALKDSSDEEAVLTRLATFGGKTATWLVIDLDNGQTYSNQSGEPHPASEEQQEFCRDLSGSGILEPYLSTETGQKMLGCYECFTFADGTRGIILKEQLLSSVADEFSLSFYDNTGFSYIVNQDGDILIRSNHRNSNRTFANVFDIVDLEGNSTKRLEDFRKTLAEGKSGVARFSFGGEEYVYTYVPLEIGENWFLISIVPNSVIMQQADQVLKSSQMFIFLMVAAAFVLVVFFVMRHLNKKRVMEKDRDIRYREQLFSILANITEDVFVMFNTDDHSVKYISPNVERVLGIPSEEIKLDISTLYSGQPGEGGNDFYKMTAAMEPGSSTTLERERIHRTTGEKRWFVETIYWVSIDGEDRFIVALSDRTAEKHKEKALEQALEIAEVANQSKSTFLSNMSHDIRTPMNAIVGLCTLLQRDAGNEARVREHTRKITASSQHLLSLINDVLDMSKIESGKTTLNITEINLAEIVEELGTIIRPQAKAKEQEFEISVFDVQAENLLGDKLRINQILINILSNAVKYTQVGGKVEMILRQLPQTAKNYANLRFVIKDNGMGMSEEYLKTIFQPFTREKNSSTNKIQGTGLGMAITKNLVDLMGGTISVESEQGKGSTFTLDLELRMQDQEIDEDFWQKHGITHALIVDDEVDICTSVVGAMAGTGVSMQFALSGASAVNMVEKAHQDCRDFNLVLLDWKMPEMDGLETARRIRQILPSDTPILILTAYDWDDIEEEALAAGIDGFLPKPFFFSNFRQTIETMRSKPENILEKAPKSALSGKHVLAAEDIELNAEILTELLDMVGATCEVEVNGKKALERFEGSAPDEFDLILMDVQMPVMNGYEATRAIRACSHPRAKTIPIIAMTADAFAEDVRSALDAGMNAHVSKPIDLDKLETAVRDNVEVKQDRS